MMVQKHGGKGQVAEEALRNYFLSLGYFTVRSLPFNYKGFDVTDVDLWLYMKSSSLARERTCVDVKRKRTPQAMERVFWTKGLREVLCVDRAVVVTTDNREETRDFGATHDVSVLHGDFFNRVIAAYSNSVARVTDEQFFAELKTPCVVDADVEWSQFYKDAKAILLDGLNFNNCNTLLMQIRFLLEEYLSTDKSSKASIRLLYVLFAYLLITLDYICHSITNLDPDLRKICLADGFRYGDAGRERTDKVVDMALKLLADSAKADLFCRADLKSEVDKQLSEYPAEMIAEYFAKAEVLKHLFEQAKGFESNAYAAQMVMPHQCPSEQKAVIGLLCDFLKIDRRQII
jgi:hypothetical protein